MRHPTVRHVALRLLAGVGVMWGAATLTFVVLLLVQGDQVSGVVGTGALVTPEVRAQIVHEYGFDQPIVVQYLRWIGHLLTGDLGRSYQLNTTVGDALAGQIGPTAALAGAATAIALTASLTLALLTAGRGRLVRGVASAVELVAVAVPAFWVGLLALTYLSFRWGVFPGAGSGGLGGLLLPSLVLALPLTGLLTQVLRQALDEALAQPFALSARARGAGPVALIARHALRHALATLTTLVGWMVATLFGGAVLIETVFARPGLGRVLLSAVTSRDLPVVSAIVLLVAAVFTVVNLLVDLAYRWIDPRLRTAPAATAARPTAEPA
ncbi:ABC transporter permease [Patulibacter defluvii]|uniref:ABC transporter permease n=1 Tax=Patulibacter defluvii TaxID=3095358 RepID=UPI002A760EAA|nr:ABC transporter permease [Patulibacter sp. DM4]